MAVLKVQKREGTGKYVAFNLRKEGMIPAVLYGKDAENVNLAVNEKEIQELVKSGERIFDLDIEGKTQKAVLKAAQHENIGDKLIHADFRLVDANTVLHVEVEVELVGTAAGEDVGGVVEQDLHKVHIACKPADLPEVIKVDISKLVVGSVLYVSDLPAVAGVEYQTQETVAVVSCHGASAEEEGTEEEAAAEE